ncbi:MAG: xanthine dehydrogenase family protein molybdopterin-binding subunit [Pseudomonadota bacterium]
MSFQSQTPQVGLALPRADAWTKALGRERFAADAYPENFLWVGVKRSDQAHARLLGIDLGRAKSIPGVKAVLTHQDAPAPNRHGLSFKDTPVLVDDKVRRRGDPLALVLAENRTALKKALDEITATLDPLPGVFDPEQALLEGAPLVHENHPGGNLLAEVAVRKGLADQGFRDCDVIIEGRFEVQRQEHAYLETEAGWAQVDAEGNLLVVASTQSPFRDWGHLAGLFKLPPNKVRVQAPFLGGGFGGKDGDTVQSLLALAAFHAGGRPVKMWWDREESFLAGVKRLPGKLHYRLGAANDGTLVALQTKIILDGGPYDHLCAEVLALAVEHSGGPYRLPHADLHGWCAYTNNPASGAFRGFGVPQVAAAMEQMMDMLAQRLDLDPLALRRKNIVRRGDENTVGVVLTQSTGAEECLEQLSRREMWRGRQAWIEAAGPFKRRGVGLACLWHGSGYGPHVADYANAKIELTADGRFRVDAPVSDMGQGNASTFLQIAGDILGQKMDRLEIATPDTRTTLPSCSSAASRTTYTYANALIPAARDLKRRLLEKASILLLADSSDEFILAPGAVRSLMDGREIPLPFLASAMPPAERISTAFWRAPSARNKLDATVKTALGLPHLVFSYACHLALVEIDELTGAVEVKGYLAVTDAGRVINPQAYEQQVQGGIVQGLGYALFEDYRVDDRGRGLCPNLATYIIPTALDAPDLESLAVQTHEPSGPHGLKGVGEIPINGPLPAVSNAVAAALGVRIFQYPITAERVLQALRSAGQ